MEILLNEKSLDGQFSDLNDFYETLPAMSRNLKILRTLEIPLLKHSSLYGRRITDDITIYDLRNSKGSVKPVYRDQIRQWKRELSLLVMDPPFWDEESDESQDSLEEAARRGTDVLSFDHPKYRDTEICLNYKGRDIFVKSAVTTKYLMDLLTERGKISSLDFLKMRYGTGKIRTEYLDPGQIRCFGYREEEKFYILMIERDHSVSDTG